ncbi:MAG TPA: pyridoxal-dependent decarboxylase [Thermoanaerobaculia bacterium]|nr:pyridoxal-dependent decarboxylase [Thermoanaerobaculia bacterium]
MHFDSDMRAFAHDLVDRLFDHVEQIDSRPVVDWKSAPELRALLRDTNDPIGAILEHSIQLHHPSYMGHQVCPPFPSAILGDLLISTLNQSTAVWEMSPAGTVIEQEVVRWLADRAGYPAESLGTAVSGGSAANLTGLLAARARWRARGGSDDPVILAGADTHYSVARAASIMGIERVIKIETGDAHRMSIDALARNLGPNVLAIVATSGSTATGAFDDLEKIRDLAPDTWLHVDAAHGASVLLSDRLKHLVRGLDRADSFSWDPHKMLWMPLSLGAILVRDGQWLRRAFEADAPYLFHAERELDNIGAVTIQCSKRADAIKLWLTLKLFGTAPFTAALEKVTGITRYLYDCIVESGDFEAMHEPDFNIFCFRYRGTDEQNLELRERLIRSGESWITSTVLRGRRVLRVTMINPRTEREHVDAMLESLRRLAR